MLDVFPSTPPSCKIEDYFCQVCGGLHRLPDQLLFEPVMLRWCICRWPALQSFFARAADYYATPHGPSEEEASLWVVEHDTRNTA